MAPLTLTNRPRLLASLTLPALLAALALSAAPHGANAQAAVMAAPGVGEIDFPRGDKDPTNAALLYYKVWIDPYFKDFKEPCNEQFQSSDAAWRPSPELCKLLKDHQGFIAMVLRATQAPECDFGIEWSQGIGTILPHLGYSRSLARILGTDARRCMMEGKFDEAAERVAAIYRLAGHVAKDGVLISGLVSAAIVTLADSQVTVLMSNTSLTVNGKQMILTEAKRLQEADSFGIKSGIAGEKRWTCDWLRGYAKGPEAGKLIAAQITPLADPNVGEPINDAIGKMTETEVGAELDRCEKLYADVLAMWDLPDAKERLKVIESRLESGEYGTIAKVLTPAVGKALSSDTKIHADHAALIERLEGFIALSR